MSETYVSSGTISNTTISSGGVTYVYINGTAIYTSVESAGELVVFSGGVASATDVYLSGILDVAVSGYAASSVVNSGGEQYVLSGGAAYKTTLNYDSKMILSGLASFTTINSGGLEFVGAGGSQYETTIGLGGTLLLAGADGGTTVDLYGTLAVLNGGEDGAAVVSRGGYMVIEDGGTAYQTSIESGGLEVALAGGQAEGYVRSGGYLIAAGGANVSGMILNGGTAVSSGIAIYHGFTGQVLTSSLSYFETVSGASDAEFVLSRGLASHSILSASASEYIFNGGTALGAVVSKSRIIAYSGSTVSDTNIVGGAAYVSGATLYETTVSSGGGDYGFLSIATGATSGTEVHAGGVEVVYGGTAYSTEIGYNGEQDVIGSGAVAAGAAILSGGIEFAVSGGVVSDNTIGGGILNLVSGGIATSGIDFDGPFGLLLIDSTDVPSTTISGFGADDTIQFADLTYSQDDRITIGTPDEVTITAGGTVYNLVIEGAASDPLLLVVGANGSGLALLDTALPCFAAGTRILTPRGEVAVEDLAVGDTVITSTGDDAPIIWIGRRRIDLTHHPKPEKAQPIRIDAEAFGDGVPSRDLLLSPDHALFIGGVLIPAKALINNRNIQQLSRRGVTYFHIELAEHAIIFAENCPVETYLDTGNRSAFENGAGVITLHPDFAQTRREQQSCAPFTVSGPALEAAREATLRRYYEQRAAHLNS